MAVIDVPVKLRVIVMGHVVVGSVGDGSVGGDSSLVKQYFTAVNINSVKLNDKAGIM